MNYLKYMKGVLLVLGITTLLLIKLSCRKIENNKEKVEVIEIDKTVKFFQTNSVNPAVLKVIEDLKKKNAEKEFVNELVNKNGYPIWDKAVVNIKTNASNARTVNESGDTIVLAPLSIENTEVVNSFFASKINGDVTSIFFNGFNYQNLKFGNYPSLQEMTANKLVINIIKLEFYTFGHKNFKVKDRRLFTQDSTILNPATGYGSLRLATNNLNGLLCESENCWDPDGDDDPEHNSGNECCCYGVSQVCDFDDWNEGGFGTGGGPTGGSGGGVGTNGGGGPTGGGGGPSGGGLGWEVVTDFGNFGYENYEDEFVVARDNDKSQIWKMYNVKNVNVDSCLKILINEIIYNAKQDLGKLLIKLDRSVFEGPTLTKFKIEFESIDSLVDQQGNQLPALTRTDTTSSSNNFISKILISRKFSNKSTDLFMITTIIHEIVHSYMNYLYIKFNNGVSINQLQNYQLSPIFNGYIDTLVNRNKDSLFVNIGPNSNFQHNFMMNFLIDWMKNISLAYTENHNYPSIPNNFMDEYMWYLNFGGLQNTNVWNQYWSNYPNLPILGLANDPQYNNNGKFSYPLNPNTLLNIELSNNNDAIANVNSAGRKKLTNGCY